MERANNQVSAGLSIETVVGRAKKDLLWVFVSLLVSVAIAFGFGQLF